VVRRHLGNTTARYEIFLSTGEKTQMPVDVLVLGAGGDFGHVAVEVFSEQFCVLAAARRPVGNIVGFDALCSDDQLSNLLKRVRPNGLAVNAVAILGSEIVAETAVGREQAIAVNAVFPNRLARMAARHGVRVVHISTDAVFPLLSGTVTEDDRIGPEDFYGLTKAAGELADPHCITLRCSIVGPPAPEHSRGLWAWIMSQRNEATVNGFLNQSWSGLTTRQLATTCAKLVDVEDFARVRRDSPIHHLAPNPAVSKFEIVQALARVLRPDLRVEIAEAGKPVTRALSSRYTALNALTPHFATWTEAIAAAIG
jgi:dTDP-4-dehydrorhamnose reductase